MPTLIIEEYNPVWPVRFAEEKQRIQERIGNFIEDIQHVGSTSVPGLAAKPIVDIMVVIPDITQVERCVRPLESINYLYMGEYGIPDRHLFCKPGSVSPFERLYHLHMMDKTHEQYTFHLLFRNYLRKHTDVRDAYQQLKRDLAVQFGANREGYTNAKHNFIRSTIVKAQAEQA
ncbi:MAG TPA: GrpB family protein [Ktedonobacteraceae bacterium]|nr:GrpB family protein [Ktedonobacteraceae bacterium]